MVPLLCKEVMDLKRTLDQVTYHRLTAVGEEAGDGEDEEDEDDEDMGVEDVGEGRGPVGGEAGLRQGEGEKRGRGRPATVKRLVMDPSAAPPPSKICDEEFDSSKDYRLKLQKKFPKETAAAMVQGHKDAIRKGSGTRPFDTLERWAFWAAKMEIEKEDKERLATVNKDVTATTAIHAFVPAPSAAASVGRVQSKRGGLPNLFSSQAKDLRGADFVPKIVAEKPVVETIRFIDKRFGWNGWWVWMAGDGNCFFYALSYALFGTRRYHKILRGNYVKWSRERLAEDPDLCSQAFVHKRLEGSRVNNRSDFASFDAYLKYIERDGSWPIGGEETSGLIAEMLSIVIEVYYTKDKKVTVFPIDDEKRIQRKDRVVKVIFDGVEHYSGFKEA